MQLKTVHYPLNLNAPARTAAVGIWAAPTNSSRKGFRRPRGNVNRLLPEAISGATHGGGSDWVVCGAVVGRGNFGNGRLLNMAKLQATTSLLALALAFPASAIAQDRPPGAAATGCDPDAFVAIRTPAGSIAYWNNPTCPAGTGASDADAAPEAPAAADDDDDDDDDKNGNGYPFS